MHRINYIICINQLKTYIKLYIHLGWGKASKLIPVTSSGRSGLGLRT